VVESLLLALTSNWTLGAVAFHPPVAERQTEASKTMTLVLVSGANEP
jgi:hypothetical protein